jgi:hypothetical protein
MISDGVTAKQSVGATDGVEVVDVATVLLRSVKPESPTSSTEAEVTAAS